MGILLLMSSTHHSTKGERNVYDAWTILELLNIRRKALAIDVASEGGAEYWKNRVDQFLKATNCETCEGNVQHQTRKHEGQTFCKDCNTRRVANSNPHDSIWPFLVQSRTGRICGSFLQLKAIIDGECDEDLSLFLEMNTESSLTEFFRQYQTVSSDKHLNLKSAMVGFLKDPIEDAHQHLADILATVKESSDANAEESSVVLSNGNQVNKVEQYHRDQLSLCLNETEQIMEWFRSSSCIKPFVDGGFLKLLETLTITLDSCHFSFGNVTEKESYGDRKKIYLDLVDLTKKLANLLILDKEDKPSPIIDIQNSTELIKSTDKLTASRNRLGSKLISFKNRLRTF
uniref:Uncharacterized protein n=1 Tax=Plectus sambesii TaxID=2011161 RepID=A0A914W3Y8_9BILA